MELLSRNSHSPGGQESRATHLALTVEMEARETGSKETSFTFAAIQMRWAA